LGANRAGAENQHRGEEQEDKKSLKAHKILPGRLLQKQDRGCNHLV
jgi:hypothetical protein